VTPLARFLFDECLSRPVVENDLVRSLRLFGSGAEVAHLITKFGEGAKDLVWIPEVAKERGWIIITADQGIHSKKSEKLPKICRAYGVTHVMISRGLHKRTMFYKALAISSVWGKLLALADVPRGGGYRLSMIGDSGGFQLANVSEPPPEADIFDPTAEKHQQPLFRDS
jgi:hypothetical protein